MRRAHARAYDAALADSGVEVPRQLPERRHVYHVYAIRSRKRDQLQEALQQKGIQTGLHYPIPVHLQPAHADLGYRPGSFPESERAAAEVLSLPMYPELDPAAPQIVAEAVGAAIREGAVARG
jgi:dTDP-4-amino-4,6-dideoxygalactose transaminase